MERVHTILAAEDYQILVSVIGNEQGDLSKIFDPKDKLLHTTNSKVFLKMLESGVIHTGGETQKTPGASFTDGNFPEAITFQLIYDNVPSGGKEKCLQSERYAEQLGGGLSETFISYLWKNYEEIARSSFKDLAVKISPEDQAKLGIDPDDDVITLEQAIKIGKYFQPSEREGYGVTLVYDQEKADELDVSDATTQGLQSIFEKRSFRKDGVPLSEASIVLVPRSHIDEIKSKLVERGLMNIDVRASEEMEARRILERIKGEFTP